MTSLGEAYLTGTTETPVAVACGLLGIGANEFDTELYQAIDFTDLHVFTA